MHIIIPRIPQGVIEDAQVYTSTKPTKPETAREEGAYVRLCGEVMWCEVIVVMM